jgi:cytochrome c-type biogenesis protein CcmE
VDHDRKRQVRLVVALSAAVLLAVALIYTSFSASSEAREPSEVLAAGPSDETYQVEGKVISTNKEAGFGRDFEIVDKDGHGERLRVLYPEGVVPDPFRVEREVVVTGTLDEDGVLSAEKDSLITKCPSKFSDEVTDDTNVEYVDP